MNEVFYHLTSPENAEKILVEGLKPMIGKNSKWANDDRKAIFLCKEKDIPYWGILLGYTVVLKVNNLKESELEYNRYSYYDEYLFKQIIEPLNIEKTDIKPFSLDAMANLSVARIKELSCYTEMCARYYNRYFGDSEYLSYLEGFSDTLIESMDKIKINLIDREFLRKNLKEYGEDGEYTFCDTYLDTGNRLYNQLLYYKEDSLSKKRKKIYDYILESFDGCLDVNTGGWSG